MRKFVVGIAAVAMVAAACTAGGSPDAPSAVDTGSGASNAPVELNVWSFYSGREFKQYNDVLDVFKEQYPWITINHTPGKSDQDVLRAVNSGTAPDLMISSGASNVSKFCSTGAYADLNPLAGQDGLDLAATVAAGPLAYSSFEGSQCALPVLSDAYGLYYNTDLFDAAGIKEPPKTFSELTADAKKLTVFNDDGSIKIAGYVPLASFYENSALFNGNYGGASWYDDQGKAAFATDPAWAELLMWQKDFINEVYGADGYNKLQEFFAKLGGPDSEWSSANGFEAGKIAMVMDGEWRNAFIEADSTGVPYATAPFPVADDTPELYGSGHVNGDVVGIPSSAEHPAEAWLLLKYLALDTKAEVALSQVLKNVPTTFESLKDPTLGADPNFKTFLDIAANPDSRFKPLVPIGQTDEDLWGAFVDKWEAGQIPDLQKGLGDVANQVDQQLQLG